MVNTTDIPQLLITVQEASQAISISAKTVRNFIRTGRLSSVNLGIRMTRIRLQDLILMAEEYGIQVEIPSYTPVSNDNKKRIVPNFSYSQAETGAANKTAKCRRTPKAGEKTPDGVTHATHYTMAEVLSRFNIKYGRFYEVRNRFQLQSVHAWGTTCFKKDEVENAIKSYNDEQGKSLSDDWYTCFEIMKLYGLGKTQVRRFAETCGVRIKQVKGGRANYYLKADWEAARKKAAKNSASVKAKRG